MRKFLNKLAKWLLVTLGALVILLAIGIGAFRVFVARAPGYQEELQAWVAGELGLFVSFDQLNARWGLRGPELTLDDVRIGRAGATAPLIAADSIGIGLNALALLLDREIRLSRLTIAGLSLSVERSADGRYQLADAPAGEGANFGTLIPEHVEVIVRGGQVRYYDAARAQEWRFDGVAMSLTRTAEALAIEARAAPAAGLAERLELTLEAELGGEDLRTARWRLSSDLRDVDVAALARLLPTETLYAVAGTGDAAFSIERTEGRIVRAEANLDLADVVLPGAEGTLPTFDHLALAASLRLDASGGWRLALADVDVARAGRSWPLRPSATLTVERRDGVLHSIAAQSDFVRLDDLEPILRALPPVPVLTQWVQLDPRGDLRNLEFALTREAGGDWAYSLGVQFMDLGFAATAGRPGIRGLTGSLTTEPRSGTLELMSRDVTLDWPAIFGSQVGAESLSGSLVWRQGRDIVRVVSNDLAIGVLGTEIESSLELTLPLDGSSPHLDLEARGGRVDLVAGKRYLPVPVMPRPVVSWLESAIQGGTARNLELSYFGPVAAFPFDGGEGYFRVGADIENTTLAYVPDWPRAEELDGRVDFVNAGFRATGRGHILGNRAEDFSVEIPELRNAVLTVAGRTEGPLEDVIAFLRGAPLIATKLGPEYSRLHAYAGTGAVGLRLDMPLRDRGAFALDAELRIAGGELSVEGFPPRATEINGVLDIDGTAVTAQRIEAIFLDGPVSASVAVPEEPGYRAALAVDGEATAASILSAFGLPLVEQIGGQTRWEGRLLLPARAEPPSPLRLEVQTNLTGVALNLPVPLSKEPGEPTNVELRFTFPPEGGLAVDGNLGATRRLALRYVGSSGGLELDRGTVQLGGDPPLLPSAPGLVIRGTVPALDLGEWLTLADASSRERTRAVLAAVELDIGEFAAFGQRLGATRLDAHRETDFWNIEISSEAIAGYLSIPRTTAGRPQIVANMERVYWALGNGAESQELDPRTLPGIALQAAELAFDDHRLGRVSADLVPDALGLRLVSFTSVTGSFAAEGSGSWLAGSRGPATRVAVNVTSTDVAAALGELGFAPFLAAELADVTASLYWPGGPDESWRDHVSGDVAVRFEKGSLPELDPGAGRVVGLLSIAALPRRLALDFRDVISPGFVFDEMSGDFTVIDGNAYTDNLKMAGPSAEIGVIGRTGLRDRDYQQQAVVTAEPGNMLPTVGALVAGPTVGAAWWLFMRIFRQPLKGIGRASYCVTGTWEDPQVERLTGDRLEEAQQCAALPPGGFSAATEQN
jgi:uncharacterized protein (TIGR02099 family)